MSRRNCEELESLVDAHVGETVANATESCERGIELHSRIPPQDWSVTLTDLDDFVERVREEHREGRIPQVPGETSDHHDNFTEGPSMAAVNLAVVIPETRRAGGVSWALMLHPEGRAIGAFVSHSFKECIYEFHRKVRGAMPGGLGSIWTCVLSNPQAWGREALSVLLGPTPLTDSPCARAIPKAEVFLAVPSRDGTIFHRSWCALEACVAFEHEVQVLPALDIFPRSKRTSIGSATAEVHKVQNVAPLAVNQLFAGFESVRLARSSDPEVEARIKEALRGKEDWLDGQIRGVMMELL